MIDKPHTACFTGHRDIPQKDISIITDRTKAVIESLIQKGVIYYGNGAARGYDLLTAKLLLDMKKQYSQIRLILILPCRSQTDKWTDKADIALYNYVLDKADKKKWLSEKHYKGCELVRNRYMVDFCGYCIAYLTRNIGGTAYTVNYAKKNRLNIINVM